MQPASTPDLRPLRSCEEFDSSGSKGPTGKTLSPPPAFRLSSLSPSVSTSSTVLHTIASDRSDRVICRRKNLDQGSLPSAARM
ncbi:uncharacterized protein M6B38_149500 [Iris pallida]|uniref:Uncharacterized protein n=1 Tax=Iris pallida TaxID=29817 RepID=A0AAX6F7N8_IRIPA|nr:uncharacterized protein M6B38_149500 [Iris pallida]